MAKRTINNVKLGLFVLTGLVLLIFFFYMLSKNQSFFASRFEVKVHFQNVNGLVPGNNVRVSGIVVGIVEAVDLVQDTLVVVTLALNDDMKKVIRKNATASIGTDGLIGNRVVDLLPAREPAPMIKPGDVLLAQNDISTGEMLRTLDHTNRNVLVISEKLLETIDRINKSSQLATLLTDETLSNDLKTALQNLRTATGQASATMADLRSVVGGVRQGEGTVGMLLRDSSLALELNQTVRTLQSVEQQAGQLVRDMSGLVQNMDEVVSSLQADLQHGQGPAHLLINDSLAAVRLQQTLGNLETGTARFSENMEALKHNFLFRRYFKKQQKKQKKQLQQ